VHGAKKNAAHLNSGGGPRTFSSSAHALSHSSDLCLRLNQCKTFLTSANIKGAIPRDAVNFWRFFPFNPFDPSQQLLRATFCQAVYGKA
jgi:hypothetical protein